MSENPCSRVARMRGVAVVAGTFDRGGADGGSARVIARTRGFTGRVSLADAHVGVGGDAAARGSRPPAAGLARRDDAGDERGLARGRRGRQMVHAPRGRHGGSGRSACRWILRIHT